VHRFVKVANVKRKRSGRCEGGNGVCIGKKGKWGFKKGGMLTSFSQKVFRRGGEGGEWGGGER